ncbi:MAG TPA: FRG domain-containing protein [Chryseosolibacter sp.]|nr:FRG domain-containing protein [Chryseosolibacter sp.]
MPTVTKSTDGLRKLDATYEGILEYESCPNLPNGLPTYLFRGERDGYPETLTSMDRHYHVAEIDEEVYHELDDLTAYVMHQPFPEKQLRGREAGAYAQHYGLPTQIFDFTSSAKIAIAFSANRHYHSEKAKGGNIAILDVGKALKAGCLIEDLRHHRFAKRAYMQQAFGMIYTGFKANDFYDLKDPDIVSEIGLIWIPFAHLDDDEAFLASIGANADILSTTEDSYASLAQEFVDEYVKRKGKFSIKAAKILSNEIPAIGRSKAENFSRWSDQ